MTIGHPGAFGLGIAEENIDKFVSATDEALKDMPDEPCYYVDYIFNGQNVDKDVILDIGSMNDYWGKDLDRSYIAIKDLTVTSEMTTIYAKSTNTLKIHLSSGVDLMLFDAPDELCELVQGDRCVTLDIVGRCSINEFYNKITPQVLIEDWQISKKLDYYF
jgi:single-stranded-DNA-specific exonuclease